MSIVIPPSKVIAVLLADGWHSVSGGSFAVDGYAFRPGVDPLPGFTFTSIEGELFAGPLSSIVSVVQRGGEAEEKPDTVELPQWCGRCEGPELAKRWVDVPGRGGRSASARCPRCHPHARA